MTHPLRRTNVDVIEPTRAIRPRRSTAEHVRVGTVIWTALSLAGCLAEPESHTETSGPDAGSDAAERVPAAEQACLDFMEAAAQRYYACELTASLEAARGIVRRSATAQGISCHLIRNVRDLRLYYEECLPEIRSAPCTHDGLTAASRHPACSAQLTR